MKKPSLVYFDIDRTLIDTTQLITLIEAELASNAGLAQEVVRQTYLDYVGSLKKSSDFSLEGIVRAHEQAGVPREIALAAYTNPEHYANGVYPEVFALPPLLKDQDIKVGIFSEGNREWQTLKLELSGLDGLFPEGSRLIFPRKTNAEAVAQLQVDSLLLDDNPEVLRQVQHLREDVRCVWIDRNEREGQFSDLECISDLRSDTIAEILEIMGSSLEQLGNQSHEQHIPARYEGNDGQNQGRNGGLSPERED